MVVLGMLLHFPSLLSQSLGEIFLHLCGAKNGATIGVNVECFYPTQFYAHTAHLYR